MTLNCEIVSTSRDLVGNNITVKANIAEKKPFYTEIIKTIILQIPNGASMPTEEIEANVVAIYELSLEE